MKRPFTLMEVLLAFSIAAVVIGSLLGTFLGQIKLDRHFEASKSAVLSRAHIRTRLTTAFQNVSKLKKENDPVLRFEFDAGIDPDLALSNDVYGSVLLNSEGALCFTIGESEGENSRLEILETDVSDLSFTFFPPGQGEAPLFVKMVYTKNEVPFTYVFQVGTNEDGYPFPV